MAEPSNEEAFTPEEAQERFDAALRAALHTPPRPLKERERKRSKKAADAPERY